MTLRSLGFEPGTGRLRSAGRDFSLPTEPPTDPPHLGFFRDIFLIFKINATPHTPVRHVSPIIHGYKNGP